MWRETHNLRRILSCTFCRLLYFFADHGWCVTLTRYNRHAEANNLVILYPQAFPTELNPKVCQCDANRVTVDFLLFYIATNNMWVTDFANRT